MFVRSMVRVFLGLLGCLCVCSYVFVWISVCMSVCLPVWLSVCARVCLFACTYTHLLARLGNICMPVRTSCCTCMRNISSDSHMILQVASPTQCSLDFVDSFTLPGVALEGQVLSSCSSTDLMAKRSEIFRSYLSSAIKPVLNNLGGHLNLDHSIDFLN